MKGILCVEAVHEAKHIYTYNFYYPYLGASIILLNRACKYVVPVVKELDTMVAAAADD